MKKAPVRRVTPINHPEKCVELVGNGRSAYLWMGHVEGMETSNPRENYFGVVSVRRVLTMLERAGLVHLG